MNYLNKKSCLPEFMLSGGLALLLLSVVIGGIHFYSTGSFILLPSTAAGLSVSVLLIAAGFLSGRAAPDGLKITVLGTMPVLFILIISDFPDRRYSILNQEFSRLIIFSLTLVCAVLLHLSGKFFVRTALTLTLILIPVFFMIQAGGRLIFSDDHPCFLYRLTQLKENFPFIPFFNPLWNGGADAREFFPSGVLNMFFILSPLIYLFKVESIYNISVALILFAVLPGSVFLSCRRIRLSHEHSLAGAVLALSSSLFWYRWALFYGTMGFITSVALMPLCLSLFAEFADEERDFTLRDGIVFAALMTLMFFWSLSVVVFLPLFLLVLVKVRKLLKKRVFLPVCAVLLILNLPWMLTFAKASRVYDFISIQESSPSKQETRDKHFDPKRIKAGKDSDRPVMSSVRSNLKKSFESYNPLIIFLSLPGLLLLRSGTLRNCFFIVSGWLLFLGSTASIRFPQLELDRMLIVLPVILTVPAALAMQSIAGVRFSRADSFRFISGSFCFALLLFGGYRTIQVVRNSSVIRYYFASPLVGELTGVINEHSGTGRTIFAGFTLHELSHGHVAPLAYFTQKPLIASSYQHNLWRYTDVIPPSFLAKKSAGVEEFLELYNVSLIITHDSIRKKWYRKRPALYSLVWEHEKFSAFKRNNFTDRYWLEGSGEILSQSGSDVTLTVKSKESVIKFNYFDFLTADNCTVSPHPYSKEISLIKLEGCDTAKPVRIYSKGPLSRLLD